MHKEFTEKDFRSIMDLAHTFYIEDAPTKNKALFICQCYVKATIMYLKGKGYGLENENTKT